jgi:low temperature requirement protein LtrA
VLLALLVIQPVVGFVHHRVFKKVQKRQVWSYMHLTIGRVGITLGIINGGLGLYISNASAYYTRVYAIVAAVMWALWMVVAIWAEIRRLKKSRQGKYTAVAKTPRAASDEGGSQE